MVPMFHSLQLPVTTAFVQSGAIAGMASEEFPRFLLEQETPFLSLEENSEHVALEGETEGSECQAFQVADYESDYEAALLVCFSVQGLRFCHEGDRRESHEG
jgi:hypothetical protein